MNEPNAPTSSATPKRGPGRPRKDPNAPPSPKKPIPAYLADAGIKIGDSHIGRLIDRKTAEVLTLQSRSAIYRGVKDGTFPPPIQIGKRRVGWRESDIHRWMEKRPSGTRQTSVKASQERRADQPQTSVKAPRG